ncbi:hypothetical protein Hamer_G024997 [Homarus americanus]|uniref:Uncharacterized protein n=1 Tax=Homarus americanus TaxID=6706 RepID=A0A8J5K445_HOMAM|nr:hypothetical protein Hamer_G024997 [Homarus americanus]
MKVKKYELASYKQGGPTSRLARVKTTTARDHENETSLAILFPLSTVSHALINIFTSIKRLCVRHPQVFTEDVNSR